MFATANVTNLTGGIIIHIWQDMSYDADAQSGDMNFDSPSNILDMITLANCILAGNCGDF